MEMDARKNANCLTWNIYHPSSYWNKTVRALNQYDRTKYQLYNALYRPQHVDKQMKDVFNGELQFGIGRVPNHASVPLNGDMSLEQFEHCSARVPIQPREQQNSYEQNLSI